MLDNRVDAQEFCPPHAVRSDVAVASLFAVTLALIVVTQVAAHGTSFMAPSGAVTHGDLFVVAAGFGGVVLHFVRFAGSHERRRMVVFGLLGVVVAASTVPAWPSRPFSVAVLGLARGSVVAQLHAWATG